MTDPIELTDLERHWDALQKFELRERYVEQSAHTKAGQPAPYHGPLTMPGVRETFERMFA